MEMNTSVVKGNRPLRMFAVFMVILIVVAHFLGQIDLTENWIFWIALAMAANAVQASFSGFCPMFKNARGECVACGVACCAPEDREKVTASESCCDSSDCCSDRPESEKKSSSCCEASSDCCSNDAIQVKVLGSGCKNCDQTARLIENVAEQLQLTICLRKEEDLSKIASYGVMSTPGVVINEKVVHSGSVPTKAMVEEWLKSILK
ncbi:MTH895/ArsE family thioredoxin-like protein [Thiomicrorhabdus sp.]|uniref:MTH895/ArsE family thioredoxin-like protein n=1 Tax=Thiomicrorhabdus sp. TaxID=2039724 RepID=UPI0029C6916E|nr:MTH895/ArsE family thioredoxin-like protein [Thiomicrorhabdus sp.]